ncbi:transcription factor [Fusarium bulbicola]|nr:transcription factor [Fusarium bulbicola]
MSETSYATSAGYLMLEDGEMKAAPPFKVPPRPPEADNGVRHVFGDLRPYTCLFSRCVESNTDFDRRWQLHISQYHWRTWSCPFKCESTLPSAVELGDHIRHQHLPNASDEHLAAVVARGELYVKHTGRHLGQLALHALPKIEDKELEDDVESGDKNDEASMLSAIIGRGRQFWDFFKSS